MRVNIKELLNIYIKDRLSELEEEVDCGDNPHIDQYIADMAEEVSSQLLKIFGAAEIAETHPGAKRLVNKEEVFVTLDELSADGSLLGLSLRNIGEKIGVPHPQTVKYYIEQWRKQRKIDETEKHDDE